LDDQSRTIQSGTTLAGSTFIVDTKGGAQIHFDGSGGSRIRAADGTVLLLAESRLQDTAGNFVLFKYQSNGSGDYNLAAIEYTGNSFTGLALYALVEFNYETVPRPSEEYLVGRHIVHDQRLKEIANYIRPVNRNGDQRSLVRRYALSYENVDTASRFVLSKLQEFGELGGELQPISFDYSKPNVSWHEAPYQFPAQLASRQFLGPAYRFAHVSENPTNLTDILFAAQVDGKLEAFTFRNNGGTWSADDKLKSPVAFANGDGADLGVLLVDALGQGRAALLQGYKRGSDPSVRQAFIPVGDHWESNDGYKLPFDVSVDGKLVARVLTGKFSGSGFPDLIWQTQTERGFLKNTGSGWLPVEGHGLPIDIDDAAQVIDDCSGMRRLRIFGQQDKLRANRSKGCETWA
jgi:hypothetical protein